MHCEVGRHRRVDSSGEADHGAGRQVLLAEVVADTQHQPRLELRDGFGILDRRRCHGLRRLEVHDLEGRLEERQAGQDAAVRVADE